MFIEVNRKHIYSQELMPEKLTINITDNKKLYVNPINKFLFIKSKNKYMNKIIKYEHRAIFYYIYSNIHNMYNISIDNFDIYIYILKQKVSVTKTIHSIKQLYLYGFYNSLYIYSIKKNLINIIYKEYNTSAIYQIKLFNGIYNCRTYSYI